MYIYHNKEQDEYHTFSNLRKLCKETGLEENKMYHVFSRKKEKRYNGNQFTIIKA
jgi:hypothetical protein